ncbi:uncharacterized protein LOC126734257 [Anthonomus grandis grandis]|uniref:uncharacterized protein LOC126734257 n=1 Tax=Anthonomus grandis grandis TaxID=2921223 RepID=UPI002165ADBB|nr:uncharacterized protein LOC126734257 [Anthonomus grandis grandis]
MELDSNLIGIQGVLNNCLKKTGDFSKITHNKSGSANHQCINHIAMEVSNWLVSKDLIRTSQETQGELNETNLNKIVFFLALNTEFERPLKDLDDYSHLLNIIPRLSKCLLCNLCFNLDLIGPFIYIIENIKALENVKELLDETVHSLVKMELEKQLNIGFAVACVTVRKLMALEMSYKNEQEIEDIIKLLKIILQNVLSQCEDDLQNKRKNAKIYRNVGFTMMNFLDLLLVLYPNNAVFKGFTTSVIDLSCSIIKFITLDIFISWAEIDFEDEMLQMIIAEKAYNVVNKYKDNEKANTMITMLGSFARKPRTIAERIMDADNKTKIAMVDRHNEHQKLWFRSLVDGNIFDDPDVLSCIERWWQLCDKTVVQKMILISTPKERNHKDLIIKCTKNLTVSELMKYILIYIHKSDQHWCENISDQLTIFFNKIHGTVNEEDNRNLLLLILQNPKAFFKHFFLQSFKNSTKGDYIFQMLKSISTLETAVAPLKETLSENKIFSGSLKNYLQLFETMINTEYHDWQFLAFQILLPYMEKFRREGRLEEVKYCVQILVHFKHLSCKELPKEIELYELVLNYAVEHRTIFLEFDCLKYEITELCSQYMINKCQNYFQKIVGIKESFPEMGSNLQDAWSKYYITLVSDDETKLLDEVLPDFDLSAYKQGEVNEHFTNLMKILHRGVSSEWRVLLAEIVVNCGQSNTISLITDIIVLLCEFADNQTQNNPENREKLLLALKFCLQNYGEFIFSGPESSSDKLLAINSLCRVLKHVPDPLKVTEGMSLINAIPPEVLRSLANDKEFVARIILIGDKQLCKALAQKVLSSS